MKQIQFAPTKTVVTIGNFDGLHKGHLKLIEKTTTLSKQKNYKSLVCNFDSNTKGSPLISQKSALKSSLKELGVDFLVTLNFEEEIKNLSCETFAKDYLKKRFQAEVVIVGENFRFGTQQSGDINTLKELGTLYGFSVVVMKTVFAGKSPLSSTRIRHWLLNGKVHLANRYLYQPFSVTQTVTRGYSAGGSILSYPTANLSLPKDMLSLPFGVYQTETVIENQTYPSITNIGYAPTLRKSTPVIETHILNFSGDLYHKRIKVIFTKYIRKERKFANLEALKKQIAKDISDCNF